MSPAVRGILGIEGYRQESDRSVARLFRVLAGNSSAGVSRLVNKFIANKFSVLDAAFDVGGQLGSTKRARVLVPVSEPAVDGQLQPAHAVKATAPDRLFRDQPEPALDQVEPRGPSRGEVQMNAVMGLKPAHHCRMLVGAVIVADQVNLAPRIAANPRVER
jgi:hypothetical protein